MLEFAYAYTRNLSIFTNTISGFTGLAIQHISFLAECFLKKTNMDWVYYFNLVLTNLLWKMLKLTLRIAYAYMGGLYILTNIINVFLGFILKHLAPIVAYILKQLIIEIRNVAKKTVIVFFDNLRTITAEIKKLHKIRKEVVNKKKSSSEKHKAIQVLSKIEKNTLLNWYNNHIAYPYPTENEVKELSIHKNLEVKKIKRWLENKRSMSRKREKSREPTRARHYFSEKDKMFLENYFNTKSTHPGPEELFHIADILKKEESKIRRWFIKKRFLIKEKL